MQGVCRSNLIDPTQDIVCSSLSITPESTLDGFSVDNFQCIEQVIDSILLLIWIGWLMEARLEELLHSRMAFTCNRLRSVSSLAFVPYAAWLFLCQLLEMLWLVRRIQSFNDSFNLRLVLLLHFVADVNSHLVLHLREVLVHELFHLLSDVVLFLNPDVVLSLWLFYFSLQHVLLVSKVLCDLCCTHTFLNLATVIVVLTASVLYIACIREPYVSHVVLQELSIHL